MTLPYPAGTSVLITNPTIVMASGLVNLGTATAILPYCYTVDPNNLYFITVASGGNYGGNINNTAFTAATYMYFEFDYDM